MVIWFNTGSTSFTKVVIAVKERENMLYNYNTDVYALILEKYYLYDINTIFNIMKHKFIKLVFSMKEPGYTYFTS